MKAILDQLDQRGVIDDEAVAYAAAGTYPFSLEEFRVFVDNIWDSAGGWDAAKKYRVKGACFETYHVPFEAAGKQYWLWVMYGQGEARTVFSEAEHIAAAKRLSQSSIELEDINLEED